VGGCDSIYVREGERIKSIRCNSIGPSGGGSDAARKCVGMVVVDAEA
jgi:hypothetical protein